MEETKMEEMVTFDEMDNGVDNYEYYDEPSGGGLKKLAVGVVGSAIMAAGAAVVVKNKNKIEQWRNNKIIQKLEKKGYVVVSESELEEADAVEAEQVITPEEQDYFLKKGSPTRDSLFVLLKGGVMDRYIYSGPVAEFDKIIDNNWYGETMADSEKKARNNLAYQFKKRI